MKACTIYKSKTDYKIATMYLTDTGTYVLSPPIFSISVKKAEEELGASILTSLASSKLIPYPSDNFSKELLKEIKVSSYKKLYTTMTSCSLFLDGDILTIEPNKCKDPNQGLEVVTEDIVKLSLSSDKEKKLTSTVISLLEKQY